MTCEHVRDLLLEQATTDWAEAEPHLARCPDCAALAARIRADEAALRDLIDGFAAAPPPPIGQVARRRSRWLEAGVLLAAAAAVLVIASRPPNPDAWRSPSDDTVFVHASPPPELTAAEDATQRFFDALGAPIDPVDGLDRKAEDAILSGAMKDRVAALTETEKALAEAAQSDDPLVRVIALHDLGEVYRAMGEALRTHPHPSYLTDKQRKVYQLALDDKASVQDQRGVDAWSKALEIATGAGLDPEAEALQALLDEANAARFGPDGGPPDAWFTSLHDAIGLDLNRCKAPVDPAVADPLASRATALVSAATGAAPDARQALYAQLETVHRDALSACVAARADALEAMVDACGDLLADFSAAEIRDVVARARAQLGADVAMLNDIERFVDAYETGTREACDLPD